MYLIILVHSKTYKWEQLQSEQQEAAQFWRKVKLNNVKFKISSLQFKSCKRRPPQWSDSWINIVWIKWSLQGREGAGLDWGT